MNQLYTLTDCILLQSEKFLELKTSKPFLKSKIFQPTLGQVGYANLKEFGLLIVRTALLTNKKEELINFTIENKSRLLVTRTHKEHYWPKNSIEARLLPTEKVYVDQLIMNWLRFPSKNIHYNIYESAMVMQVLRGNANVTMNAKNGKRSYTISDQGLELRNGSLMEESPFYIETLKTEDPVIDQLLDREILKGIKGMALNNGSKDRSIWLIEPESVRMTYLGVIDPTSVGQLKILFLAMSPLIGALIYFLALLVLKSTMLIYFTIAIAGLVTVFYLILLFPSTFSKHVIYNLWQFVRFIRGHKVQPLENDFKSMHCIFPLYIISVLCVTVLIVSSIAAISELFKVSAIAYLILGFPIIISFIKRAFMNFTRVKLDVKLSSEVSKKSIEAITSSIMDQETTTGLTASNQPEESSKIRENIQVKFKVSDMNDFPETSQISQSKFAMLDLRFPKLVTLYLKRIALLIAVVVFIKIQVIPLNSTTESILFKALLLFSLFWFILHFIAPSILDYQKRKTNNLRADGRETVENNQSKSARIKPNITPLLGILWTVYALYLMVLIFDYSSIISVVRSLAIVSIIVWYFIATRKDQIKLEKQFPICHPPKLLVLRIFSSQSFEDFMELINSWRGIGITNFLKGPDVQDISLKDAINLYNNKLQDSIIENKSELEDAIKRFKTEPDNELKFPTHSMQCSNDTWKDALNHFLKEADVIVVDLSAFSLKNKGILYELEKIVTSVSLEQVMFIITDITDKDLIFKLFLEMLSQIPKTSPNHSNGELIVNFFEHGGILSRRQNESLAKWENRIEFRIARKRLVCMLYDKATFSKDRLLFNTQLEMKWAKWFIKDLRIKGIGKSQFYGDKGKDGFPLQ